MKPKIGINLDVRREATTRYSVNRAYVQAIIKAGGIPVLVPPMEDRLLKAFVRELDGFVLIGGRDYSPELFGEEPSDTVVRLEPEREEFDLRLCRYLLTKTKLPILGICGGMQLLNIACGGTLCQDIEEAFPGQGTLHRNTSKNPTATAHPVEFLAGTVLRKIYRKKVIDSVSSHHQVVDRLADCFVAEGFSPDGLIEGMSHKRRPFTVGVQYHPEQDYETNKKLFRALIKAARCRS